jgi:hypothetical protein
MFYYRGQEYDVRIAEKPFLSLNEAIVLTGIGEKKLVHLSRIPNCNFILYVGAKRMFKRKQLQEYLESNYSV